MKLIKLMIFTLFISSSALAVNLSADFEKFYLSNYSLPENVLNKLKKTKIIFIPGILAETFQQDERSIVNLSLITKEYFGTHIDHLKNHYNLDASRLKTSSKRVEVTKLNILKALWQAKMENKKIIFVAHSLGGVALTDLLLKNSFKNVVQGIIYLQTPFWGSPMASVYDDNTYHIKKLLRPLLPFFNTSEKVIAYLRVDNRTTFMQQNMHRFERLRKKYPILSVVSKANKSLTLFEAAVNIMEYGCLAVIRNRCITNTVYYGQKDFSDGMVPLFSGVFPNSNYVLLKNVDHGETVVNMGPFNINRKKMIESLIKLLLE